MWKVMVVEHSEDCPHADLGKDYKFLVCKQEKYGGDDSTTPCRKDTCPAIVEDDRQSAEEMIKDFYKLHGINPESIK